MGGFKDAEIVLYPEIVDKPFHVYVCGKQSYTIKSQFTV